MSVQTGMIHKIERFSLHDGPGIRTLVVMKGCPLKCPWCSSPYTQNTGPEVLHIISRCEKCVLCIETCPNKVISRAANSSLVKTDRTLCAGCGKCVESCIHLCATISIESILKT